MRFRHLATVAVALTALCAAPALAQVTMQPIANPPEKAKPPAHKAKHHHKHAAKTAAAAAPATAK